MVAELPSPHRARFQRWQRRQLNFKLFARNIKNYNVNINNYIKMQEPSKKE